MKYSEIYQDMTLAAHRAYTRGIQTGSGGNMASRIAGADAMVVKNSGGSFGDCTAEGKGWIATDYNGKPLEGENGKPTREWLLHATLLKALPEVGAIVHFHSPYAIAWAEEHNEIPLTTWHSGLKFGCPIPVVDVPSAVVPAQAMDDIVKLFEENPALPGFVLRGHGLVAVGKTAVAAEHAAELIEETAQITVLEHLLKKE